MCADAILSSNPPRLPAPRHEDRSLPQLCSRFLGRLPKLGLLDFTRRGPRTFPISIRGASARKLADLNLETVRGTAKEEADCLHFAVGARTGAMSRSCAAQ